MVILAVDYGDARTGLAACDPMELLASPVCVIHESYQPKLIERIHGEAVRLGAALLVVGYPRNMDGTAGMRAEKCAAFAAALAGACGVAAELWDERLTTVSAHQALNVVNVRGKNRKNIVDAVAATMILEDFLRSRQP